MTEIEIILNHDELDWLDYGHGFCSLDNMNKKDYDDISWSIKEKLKDCYTEEAELKNEYHIKLTKEEIGCIQEILTELTRDDYHFWNDSIMNLNKSETKMRLVYQETINEIIESVSITNEIFKKLGIPILILDFIKKWGSKE